MEWPEFSTETFEYVTTPTAKQIWKRAALAATSDLTQRDVKAKELVDAFVDRLHNCQNWRYEYRSILYDFTALHAHVDNETALDMAQAGLDAVHDLLLYRLDPHTAVPCKDAFIFCKTIGTPLKTLKIVGTKAPDLDFQFGIADPQRPHTIESCLFGMDAVEQINAWYDYGVMETSAAVLAKTTVTCTNLPALISRKVFIVLGCTSELGPTKSLLQIPGTTVLGVARGGKRLDDVLDFCRYNSPDDTTFLYPSSDDMYPNGGADLLLQAPQIAQWILDETKDNDELVLVTCAYMDGEAHVRVTASMDLIVQRVMRTRSKSMLWSYTSPATCMVLPPTAASEACQRRQQRPAYEQWTNKLSGGRFLESSLEVDQHNHDYCILNGIVSSQGPNYVLAKTIQQWRCMITQYRDNQKVSAPFAPATRTSSMVQYDTVSNALEGMHHFEPMLAFDVEPASTLMAAILLAHLQLLNRSLPDLDESPFSMFWDGAVHGGVWTCPYTLESISIINYALGKVTYYPKGYIPPGALPVKDDDDEDGEACVDGEVRTRTKVPKTRTIDPDVLLTLTDTTNGQPMPDSVRERLDFM
ncbi:hypothetical protein IV203_032246 [Nitzschia inconspicua]|uniref:Uncharacterized protein n=1 Tax=Nitzschia inconspicua TaxID=303405 RepID=A0A9K3KKC6_9STRA|nr:hypothetical protein IV203_032246 [Nitzschia inconspicua]